MPKRLGSYIHHTGIRALDHLSENVAPAQEGTTPDAVQTLVGHWRSMSADEREDFVNRVALSVGEVIVASALLPVGAKAGEKAVKSARQVLKRSTRALKKTLRATEEKKESATEKRKRRGRQKRKEAEATKNRAETRKKKGK